VFITILGRGSHLNRLSAPLTALQHATPLRAGTRLCAFTPPCCLCAHLYHAHLRHTLLLVGADSLTPCRWLRRDGRYPRDAPALRPSLPAARPRCKLPHTRLPALACTPRGYYAWRRGGGRFGVGISPIPPPYSICCTASRCHTTSLTTLLFAADVAFTCTCDERADSLYRYGSFFVVFQCRVLLFGFFALLLKNHRRWRLR